MLPAKRLLAIPRPFNRFRNLRLRVATPGIASRLHYGSVFGRVAN